MNMYEGIKRQALGQGLEDLQNKEKFDNLDKLFTNKENEVYDVDYFNDNFYKIRKELEELKEKAKSQDFNEIVEGIDKILETWDNLN